MVYPNLEDNTVLLESYFFARGQISARIFFVSDRFWREPRANSRAKKYKLRAIPPGKKYILKQTTTHY